MSVVDTPAIEVNLPVVNVGDVAVGPLVVVPGATEGPEVGDSDRADVPSVCVPGWVCNVDAVVNWLVDKEDFPKVLTVDCEGTPVVDTSVSVDG